MILRGIGVTLILFTVIFLSESTEALPHNNSSIGNAIGLAQAATPAFLFSQNSFFHRLNSFSTTEAIGATIAVNNTIVIQTPATGALTANYTLPQPGSLSATNQAVAPIWIDFSLTANLAGTVTEQTVVIDLTKKIVTDNQFYTGSGGVSKWVSITASENLALGNNPSKITPDIDIDYATRYVQISTVSISATHDLNANTNTRLTDRSVSYTNSGITSATDTDRFNSPVIVLTDNATSFYNASCMGQYYYTVNFS